MSKSTVIGFLLGALLSAAVLFHLLPVSESSSTLDGRSLKVIMFAHVQANVLFEQEHGEATLPANHVQFLENYNIKLVERGDKYTVHYFPRDPGVRGGGYKITVSYEDGELRLEDALIER